MNGFFLAGFLIYGVIKIANSLFGDKQPIKRVGKPLYIINEAVSPIHPITKSFKVLDIDQGTLIDPKSINMAFSKQLAFANEDKMLGYTVKHSLKEYRLARYYLLDFYDYTAFLN